MNICFHKFWPGFLEGTNPNTVHFFIELFKRVFNTLIIVSDYNNADILCENACSLNDSLIYKKKWKYSILVTGECVVRCGFSEHYNSFDVFLSGLKPDIKRVKFPLFISYLFCNNNSMQSIKVVPKNMVCAIISNPKGNIRNKFLDKLEEKTHVFYGGHYRNNIGYCIGGDHNSNELINFIRQHKFVITMENSEEDYYITEKICNGLFAGIIPVYWGSPNICEYFNTDRFLHLTSENEIENIIDKMMNMDDETYLKMVSSNILVNTNTIDPLVEDIKNALVIKDE